MNSWWIVHTCVNMGWLRWVSFLKLQASFAEYPLFYRALLKKRPIILRGLLIVATPYQWVTCQTWMSHHNTYEWAMSRTNMCVTSHTCTSHDSYTVVSNIICASYSLSHTPTNIVTNSHVTRMNKSYLTSQWLSICRLRDD